MKKNDVETLIAVVAGNGCDACPSLINLLKKQGYKGIIQDTISALKKYLSQKTCMAVLIDIDTVPVENRGLRELTVQYPQSPFLCMSSDKYHPELKEAICYHIYACINKPVNPDELFYLLKCIREDNQR